MRQTFFAVKVGGMMDDAELARTGAAVKRASRKCATARRSLKELQAAWRILKDLRDAAMRERAAAGESAYKLAGVVGLTPQQALNICGKNVRSNRHE